MREWSSSTSIVWAPRGRAFLAIALAATIAAMPAPARGQSASDEASAQRLFDEGRALMSSGHFADACAKFSASEQLAPSGGTLLNLADCYEKNGQLASAWAMFQEVEARARHAGRADVEKMAHDRVKQIDPRLSFLTIVVPPEAVVEGLEVRRNGEVVPRGAWGTSLPVDGGTHRIDASAPGKKQRTLSANVAPSSDRVTLTLARLDDQPAVVAASAPEPTGSPQGPSSDQKGMPLQKMLALALGGGGIVAMGVGAVFGAEAIAKNKDAAPYCPASPRCDDPRGVQLTNDARGAATLSTVLFVAGGALVAAGVTLYLTAPSPSVGAGTAPLRFAVALDPFGAAIRGAW